MYGDLSWSSVIKQGSCNGYRISFKSIELTLYLFMMKEQVLTSVI